MNVSNLPQPSLESTYLPLALNISLYLLYQFCIAKPPNVRWKIKSPWAQAHCIYATVSPSAIAIVHHRIYVSTGWFRCCLFKWRTSNLRSLCSCLRKRKPNTPTNRKKAPYVICCVVCWAGEHRNSIATIPQGKKFCAIPFKFYLNIMQGFWKPTLTRTTACYVMHKRMRDNPRIQQHTTQFTTKKMQTEIRIFTGKTLAWASERDENGWEEKNCSNSHLKKAASLNKQAASYTWIIQNVMFISKPAMLYGYSLSLTRAATLLLLQKEKTGSSRKIHHFYDESLGNLTNLEF